MIARIGFVENLIDPQSFALIRLGAGALFLALISLLSRQTARFREINHTLSLKAATVLSIYMIGFAYAHTELDSGAGALIQFTVVQIVMFGSALYLKEQVPFDRFLGALIALGGLVIMLWPDDHGIPHAFATLAMIFAASGWGLYSVYGQQMKFPVETTCANFAIAFPISLMIMLLFPVVYEPKISREGILLASFSGAITSGLSYSLWYFILPRIKTTVAGVSQLLIPPIAMAGGIIFLNELLTVRYVFSFMCVAMGVALSVGLFRTWFNR